MGNKIELKSIYELLGMNFFIPSYQRGYRWTEQQVKDLLDDIDNFTPKEVPNSQEKTWYCLQPLVVKAKDSQWEVIDGQQRLTTIFLIIHYFNEMWVRKQKIEEPTLKYQTRENSYKFLKEMKVSDDDSVKINEENIDYQHISFAYKTIHNWVKEKGNFDNNDFQSKFKEKTKVIWYETDSKQDGRDIFSRINMGKIPLTNAELIKALFLNSSNFKTNNTNDAERIRLKQLEIANEWDFIEYSLHNDEFWLFINKEVNEKETRIEFLFELIVGKSNNAEDNYFTFRKFYDKFTDNTEQIITKNWKEIKRYFQILQNWFDDRKFYHKIGFLITLGEDIKSLIEKSQMQNKSNFTVFIDGKIKSKFTNLQIDEIEYGNGNIKSILLLHNIQTMLNNENETSRFPFNRYKREKWDIEHIHAVATKVPEKQEQQEDWLKYAKEVLKAKLEIEKKKDASKLTDEEKTKKDKTISELDNLIVTQYESNSFETLFVEISKFVGDEDVNDLSNLALLDSGTNRGYKNEFFSYKRDMIIQKDKTNTFVPICTKNAFMKYYTSTDKIEQMTFWGETDRNEYLNDIKIVLENYLLKEDKQ